MMDHWKAITIRNATPELWAALAKAQGAIATLGKDGTNTQRGYRYTTSDAMLEAGRHVLSSHGLSLITTWEAHEPGARTGDIGNQHVAAKVWLFWVLAHEGGGVVTGRATMDAIGSKARPPDKAVAAAVTYGLGFVIRGLLLINRDEDADAVDRREEPPRPSKAVQELDRATTALAHAAQISEREAQDRVCERANLWPRGVPFDAEAVRLTAAARELIAEVQKPKAKANGPFVEWQKAARAYCQAQRQAYRKAEGEEPGNDDEAQWTADVLGISAKAVSLATWPGKTATAAQCAMAVSALERARKETERLLELNPWLRGDA